MTYTLRLPKRRSLSNIGQDFLTAQYFIMHTVLDEKKSMANQKITLGPGLCLE